jgi:hypothetical protein
MVQKLGSTSVFDPGLQHQKSRIPDICRPVGLSIDHSTRANNMTVIKAGNIPVVVFDALRILLTTIFIFSIGISGLQIVACT